MQFVNEITFYLCGTYRRLWAEKLVRVFKYTTVIHAVGASLEYGVEDVLLLEHAFNEDRDWSWYKDVLPILERYLADGQDTIGIRLVRNNVLKMYILPPKDADEDAWIEFGRHLIV